MFLRNINRELNADSSQQGKLQMENKRNRNCDVDHLARKQLRHIYKEAMRNVFDEDADVSEMARIGWANVLISLSRGEVGQNV